jgi:hypothetical protein
MKEMDDFIKLFKKTQLRIERLKEIDSEVSLWEREGKLRGLEKHAQFIKANSKNLNRFDEVKMEYSKLLDLLEKKAQGSHID